MGAIKYIFTINQMNPVELYDHYLLADNVSHHEALYEVAYRLGEERAKFLKLADFLISTSEDYTIDTTDSDISIITTDTDIADILS